MLKNGKCVKECEGGATMNKGTGVCKRKILKLTLLY